MHNLERRSTIDPLHPRSPRQASARRAIPGVILQEAVLITAAWALRQVADALQPRFQNAEAPGVGVPPGSGGAGGLSPPEPTPEGSGFIFTAKRVWEEIGKDRVLSVAGGLTFFCLLALFPAITALVSVFGLFADPAQVAVKLGSLTSLMPQEAATILIDQAKAISAASSANLSLAAVVALALALWSANGGTKALIEALNVAYGVTEERGFVQLNAFSLGATICAIAIVLGLIVAVAVLPQLLDVIWLGSLTENLLLLGRWPAIFAFMLGFLGLAYRFAPNRRDAAWRWITPGAVLAAIGLLVFSLLFNWYAQNLGNYNQTYGSLGAVVALMTWMWLSATLVLVGAEVNSELDRQAMSAQKKGPAAAPANASR